MPYEALLELALTSHDPFRPAFREQYASLVLTHDETQLAVARSAAERLALTRGRPLATRIEPLKTFTLAEDYHQKYSLRNNRIVMADFRAMFADDASFRESPAAARVNGYLGGVGSREQFALEAPQFGLGEDARQELSKRFIRRSGGVGCSIG